MIDELTNQNVPYFLAAYIWQIGPEIDNAKLANRSQKFPGNA